MKINAQLNNLRISPRKVRAIVNLVKGKQVDDALNQIEVFIKKSSSPMKKLIESAIANAENNYQMVRDNLYIKSFYVDEGRKLKRYMARARGMAGRIHKKTSHITLTLDEKVAGVRSEKKDKIKVEEKREEAVSETVKTEVKKPKIEKDVKVKKPGRLSGLGRRIFQRKAI